MVAAGLVALLVITYIVLLGLSQLSRWAIRRVARPFGEVVRPLVRRAWDLLGDRWPALYRSVDERLAAGSFAGLPLTLVAIVIACGAALLGELAEEVAEAEDIVRFDTEVANALAPHRTETLVEVFKWITFLGSGVGVATAGALTTIVLWIRARHRLILPLWVTIAGAQLTTWLGKRVFDRERPDFLVGVVEESASFPSGHATASMAAYGLIAWLIAREARTWRGRFEVLFWSGALIFLIGFSRIFLSVHFVSDVAAGMLVGGIWLLAGIAWLEWREERAAVAVRALSALVLPAALSLAAGTMPFVMSTK